MKICATINDGTAKQFAALAHEVHGLTAARLSARLIKAYTRDPQVFETIIGKIAHETAQNAKLKAKGEFINA